MIIMSIDPSINNCGAAIFNDKKLIFNKLLVSYNIKVIKKQEHKEKFDYICKSESIVEQIKMCMDDYNVDMLILEVPEYWKVGGYESRESGAMFKLTFLCGMICGIKNNTITYTPSDWKKQLPKDVVNIRLRKYYPDVNIVSTDHNVVDAIGIGHFHIYKEL